MLQRIERFPRFVIVIDDMDALGDLATCGAGFAELETLVAVDRWIGLLHHLQENVRLRKNLLDQFWSDGEKFISLVEQLPDNKLDETFVHEKYGNYYRNLHGVIEHCHYHLGQIVLIKKIVLKADAN